MIHLNNVTKVYPNGSKGVENINLHISKGEFVFIVGSSGSGKSTLMKLLLKELDPTEGDIIINRVKTNELTRRQIPYLRRNLGVVFQDFRLLPNKTVYENVAFAMRVIEAPNRIIRRNVLILIHYYCCMILRYLYHECMKKGFGNVFHTADISKSISVLL